MTIVVGCDPDGHGKAVLHLAAMLARSAGEDLLVCAVVPAPWAPSPARVDAEYRDYLQRTAQSALDEARRRLPDDVPAELLVHDARSAPAGLVEVAEERGAGLIVVGSATHGGLGHVTLGSVSSRLMHSSPVAVSIAPRGFRARSDARVRRITAAFGNPEGADDLVIGAAGVAARVGAALRLASFAVRPRAPYTVAVGREADDAMIAEWIAAMQAAARAALEEVEELPAPPAQLEAEIGRGETWDEALHDVDWDEDDVLVVGSSTVGPIARVFLGTRANKIVRDSPVPVTAVPRRAAAELAEAAAAG
jgi:nucleotide-binding universal stress UspA family protein